MGPLLLCCQLLGLSPLPFLGHHVASPSTRTPGPLLALRYERDPNDKAPCDVETVSFLVKQRSVHRDQREFNEADAVREILFGMDVVVNDDARSWSIGDSSGTAPAGPPGRRSGEGGRGAGGRGVDRGRGAPRDGFRRESVGRGGAGRGDYGDRDGGRSSERGGYASERGGYGSERGVAGRDGYGSRDSGRSPERGAYGSERGGYGDRDGGRSSERYVSERGSYGNERGGYGRADADPRQQRRERDATRLRAINKQYTRAADCTANLDAEKLSTIEV